MSKILGKKVSIALIATIVLMTLIAAVPVQAETAKARLTVVVKYPDGTVVVSAILMIRGEGGPNLIGYTNKKGKFSATLPRAKIYIVDVGKNHVNAEVDVVLDGRKKLEITLEPVSP